MRKKSFLLFVILCCITLLVACVFVACNPGSGEQTGQPGEGDGGEDETLYFTVTFDTQGGSKIADIKVESGHIVGEFTLPTKQCSRLVGFALDADGERMWDVLTDKVSADITLYAIWEDAHDWGEWSVTTPATCTDDGEKTRTCNACGETEKEVVPAAHIWGEWETVTDSTCTTEGTQKRVCEVCGKEETDSIPALGHDFEEEYTVDVAPSCETTGSESRHCTRCEATTDSREIAALGHDYEGAEWHYNDANHWRYCTRCGKESERELHSYDSDGVCECGMIEVAPVNEFRFISLGNNTWRLANYTGSRMIVSIPSSYNNGKVVAISDDAFIGNTAMQTLVIPDTVTSIGARAFSGCVNLTSITISKNLTTIGEDAFDGCTQIADATIPAMAVASIDKGALTILHVTAGDIEERAFENCANLTTLTIGEDVENVGDRSFSGCSKLVYVTIEDGVKTIGKGAFVNCTGISEISVPDSVTDIGDSAFSGCSGLVEMTLPFVGGSADTTSPSASTLFGYIFGSSSFSGAFETVQLYGTEEGASATYYIPRYLTSVKVGGEILFGAFYGCDRIETITLTSATTLGDYAFYNNTSLTEIIIPDSVESLGEMTFAYCNALVDIDFPQNIKMVGVNAMMESAWYDAQLEGIVYIGKTLYDYKGTMPSNMVISVPDDIYSISEEAFAGCSGLHSITMTDSVTAIGERAFYNCYGLISIIIGDGVQSIGEEAFAGCSSLKNVTMPAVAINYIPQDNLQTVSITSGAIGERAFYNCDGLISVTIGNSVTSIGQYAFAYCDNLMSVTIGSGVTSIGSSAFKDCAKLTEINWNAVSVNDFTSSSNVFNNAGTTGNGITVTFGDSVRKIPAYTFYVSSSSYRPNIKSVTIGNSVTSIGDSAFKDCTKLTEINWNAVSVNDFTSSSNVFYNAGTAGNGITAIFGDSVRKIPAYAFYVSSSSYRPNIKSVTIGNSVTSIGDSAFSYCSGFTSIAIPDSVTSIGSSAFAYCDLMFVTIGSGVTSIGDSAFYCCSSLTSITIPGSVTSIGSSAFKDCTKLTEINWNAVSVNDFTSSSDVFYNAGTAGNGITVIFGDSVRKIPAYTFYISNSSYRPNIKSVTIGNSVTSIGSSAFSGCSGLTSVTIPDSVTSIGSSAFSGCSSLTSVTIPDSVTSIGSSAFLDCVNLTSVTIPNNVTSIGAWAFRGCKNMTSITIPDSVTSIGEYAFYGCKNMTSITIPDSVTSIGDSAFSWCSGLISINIPDSVTSIARLAFNNCSGLISVTIPDSVTSIGYAAFSGCSGLTSVTIPDSVTSIGDAAFSGCSGLTAVIIPDSVTSIGERAFAGCHSLEEITIPFVGAVAGKTSSDTNQYPFGYIFGTSFRDGGTAVTQNYYGSSTSSATSTIYYLPSSLRRVTVTGGNILYGAFYNCSMLTSIIIPNSVTSIGSSAFYGCSGLISVIIPDSVTSIGEGAFAGCRSLEEITIPFVGAVAGKTSSDTNQYPFGYIFGTSSYVGGTAVTQNYYGPSTSSATSTIYYLPSSLCRVTMTGGNILYGAFYNCSMLTSIIIPDGVTSIGDYVFYSCSGLTSIIIPDGVTSIGDYAFSECSGLTSVTIPDSVTSIGMYAFKSCKSLTSITIPNNVTSIGSSVFSGCSGLTSVTIPDSVTSIGSSAFLDCVNLTSVTIPNNVTSIGAWAFRGCSGLTSITIPDSVTNIGYAAFSSCSGLTSVTIPDSVTSIGEQAFRDCTGLMSVTIGNSVTSIGSSAFLDCVNLTSVIIKDGVTSIGGSMFHGCSSLTSITIPDSVTSIGGSAFHSCRGLTSVTIGNGVTRIEGGAFDYCRFLTSVTYNGTISEWKAISKVSGWHDECPFTEVVCSNGTVTV